MKWIINEKEANSFMKFVHHEPMSGCWLWGGGKMKTGYGSFNSLTGDGRKMARAHRYSWVLHGKELIEGLDLCHKCDIRLCVNPDHLWLGTRRENLLDCKNKGRNPNWNKTHCKHGHEYTKENTIIRYDGFRECKLCSDKHKLNYYLRKKAKKRAEFDSIS